MLSFDNLSSFSFDINMIHIPKEDVILPDVVIIKEDDILLLERIGREL